MSTKAIIEDTDIKIASHIDNTMLHTMQWSCSAAAGGYLHQGYYESHVLGDGWHTKGWIWIVGPLGKMTEDNMKIGQRMVSYSCACISHSTMGLQCSLQLTMFNGSMHSRYGLMARGSWNTWGLLKAKFWHVVHSFERMSLVWNVLVVKHKLKGYQAYSGG